MADTLKRYREKRNFALTSEPERGGRANEAARAFVVQKHWASRLHYDFRLELDGAMKSWAVPKGPSFDPTVKRMAVQVEDHPIAYNQFEGEIPKGQYGAGKVIIWDEGVWTPLGDPRKGYRDGHLKFELQGAKLRGHWALVRMKKPDERQPAWLLIKERDDAARPETEFSVVDEMPDSVVPLRRKQPAKRAAASSADGTPAESPRLPGVASELPKTLKPQLATLVDGVPSSPGDWLYEVKYDGYRLVARVEAGEARLYTRNGHDWTSRLPHLAKALARLRADAWLDGEIVVLTDNGAPSFQALQNAFDGERTGGIDFFVFDLPFVAGRDLRGEPLTLRRNLLEQLVSGDLGKHVRLSATLDARPADLVATACRMGLEGVIGKRRDSRYVSRRSPDWIKLKCVKRQEFVIVGYTDSRGQRVGFGSLLLAVHDEDGSLRYAGNVGTGFDDRMLRDLKQRMDALATAESALANRRGVAGRPHWIKPQLVAEVSFGEWTQSGHIRHSVFRGLREDKPARAITRERPLAARDVERGDEEDAMEAKAAKATGSAAKTAKATKSAKTAARSSKAKASSNGASKKTTGAGRTAVASMKLTHPERVIDPSTGLTKLDLARYYGLVAPLMVPHLKGRPVAFLRAPSGIQGERFFQKHLDAPMPGVKALPQELDPDHPSMMEVPNPEALMAAAQMNTVEFHTWNAVKSAIGKPDRMLFDLDPGEGVQWPAIVQAAKLVRVLLHELSLGGWLKTSGGKGLHVVVPLRRQYGWDTVREFSEAIVRHLARTLPDHFVAKSGPRNRVGRIFADYLRNGFGATTVAAWSARARPGMGVSVPLAWDELDGLKRSDQWTIANIHDRLDVGNAPWDDYTPQTLGRAMKTLGFEQ